MTVSSWDDFVTVLANRWPAWYQYRLQLRFADMVNTKLQLARVGVILPPTDNTGDTDG
jgi:hypothetical protein